MLEYSEKRHVLHTKRVHQYHAYVRLVINQFGVTAVEVTEGGQVKWYNRGTKNFQKFYDLYQTGRKF